VFARPHLTTLCIADGSPPNDYDRRSDLHQTKSPMMAGDESEELNHVPACVRSKWGYEDC